MPKSSNKIQKCIRTVLHHNQMGFISGKQGWFIIQKSAESHHSTFMMNKKNHMIILKCKKKNSTKCSIFMIRMLSYLGIEGNFVSLMENSHQKTYS